MLATSTWKLSSSLFPSSSALCIVEKTIQLWSCSSSRQWSISPRSLSIRKACYTVAKFGNTCSFPEVFEYNDSLFIYCNIRCPKLSKNLQWRLEMQIWKTNWTEIYGRISESHKHWKLMSASTLNCSFTRVKRPRRKEKWNKNEIICRQEQSALLELSSEWCTSLMANQRIYTKALRAISCFYAGSCGLPTSPPARCVWIRLVWWVADVLDQVRKQLRRYSRRLALSWKWWKPSKRRNLREK